MGKRKKHMKRKNTLYELQESRNGGQIALTGFTYQFLYSCYLILSTYDANTFFYLEGIEDIDKITIENEFNNTTHIQLKYSTKKQDASFLKEVLDKIEKDYDYIFIDCPPSLGTLTINALTASHSVLIPIQCEYYALEGLSQMLETIQTVREALNEALSIEGILFTMYDGRNLLSQDVVRAVKEHFTVTIFNTIIPRNVRLAEAPSHGLPINLYDGGSTGADAYRKLAGEILEKEV